MAEDPLVVSDRLVIPAVELTWRFSTSGGPGGQHANTSHTRAEVRWDVAASAVVTDHQRERLLNALGPLIIVAVDDTRSQTRNRELARTRLAERVSEALIVPTTRKPTKASRRSKQRRVDAKRRRGRIKANRTRPGLDD